MIFSCVKKIIPKRIYNYLIFKIGSIKQKRRIDQMVKLFPKDNTVFLFGCPNHPNLGDNAQTYCTELWIKKNYPGMKIEKICTYDVSEQNYYFISALKRHIKKTCLIILHSGYHTTDLYIYEELLNRAVVSNFRNFPILVMPQTVNFFSKEESKKSMQAYSKNRKVLFLARDKESYQKAKSIYQNAHIKLYPDIVTTLIGKFKSNNERNGILFCMRNDAEALYTKEKIDSIRKKLAPIYISDITDTTISIDFKQIESNREKYIYDKIDEFSRYKVVITDRYHGTIFSVIANTPVIVLNSTDHKLSSGVDWFKEDRELDGRVFFCENINDLFSYISEIYNKKYDNIHNSYYEEKYYDNLKNIFDNLK